MKFRDFDRHNIRENLPTVQHTTSIQHARPNSSSRQQSASSADSATRSDYTTPSASPTGKLTKDWIQYLKSNNIVSQQSDTATGRLKYKRKANTNDLITFLENRSDFDEDTIYSAIQRILSNNSPGRNNGAEPYDNTDNVSSQPGINTKQQSLPGVTPRLDNTSRSDSPEKSHGGKIAGEISQTPNAIRKRNARSPGGRAFDQMQNQLRGRKGKGAVTEDIIDQPVELSEKNVEDIFAALVTRKSVKPATQSNEKTGVEKLKSLIKGRLTAAQRRALWDKLTSDTLSEEVIEKSAAEQIFNAAAKSRETSFFKSHKISISDLQQDWQKAGYPLDTADIEKILKARGFSEDDIHDVLSSVLGSKDANTTSAPDTSSSVINEIADYILKNDLKDIIVAYMQSEFGDELTASPPAPEAQRPDRGWYGAASDWVKSKFKKTPTVEDVKKIFTSIILTERSELYVRIQAHEHKQMGRNKK